MNRAKLISGSRGFSVSWAGIWGRICGVGVSWLGWYEWSFVWGRAEIQLLGETHGWW